MRGIKVAFYAALFYAVGAYTQVVVNKYAKVISLPACTPCFTACNKVIVDDASNFAAGDEVLLIQMKGASAVWSQDPSFGTILSYGSAGFHEVLTIDNVAGTTLTFTKTISGNYDPIHLVQVVKVFKQANYTVPAAGVTAQDWNGNTGGVLYMDISGTLTLGGDINTSGKGFRGALNPNSNTKTFGCGTDSLGTLAKGQYYLDLSEIEFAGRKGEGVVAFRNPQYELGTGPLGNGGGGGLNHNAGGGGGGHMGAGGQGGNIYEGYTCTYQGNGLGGKVLDRMGGLRLFLGGGGGAGHENNNNGTSGGHGGGIIVIKAGALEGNGFKIVSNGMIGYNRNLIDGGPGGDDGAGGGGAGGAIKLDIGSYGNSPLSILARGGNGGSVDNASKHGSGGGGGGGLICLTSNTLPAAVTTNSEGGTAGLQIKSAIAGDYFYAEAGSVGITALGCASVTQTPPTLVPFSLGADLQLCVPPTATLSTGLASPYTFKWYKEATLIDGATDPSLSVNAAGTYVAQVETPLCPAMRDTILVTQKDNLRPVDATFCSSIGPKDVTLSITNAAATGKYVWYDKLMGGTIKGTGTSITIPNLDKDTVLYVEDTTKIETQTGPSNLAFVLSSGAGSSTLDQYYHQEDISRQLSRRFDAEVPLKLISVVVKRMLYGGNCGSSTDSYPVKILLKKNGVKLDSVTVNYACPGPVTVPLNFNIPIGTGYELALSPQQYGSIFFSNEYKEYATSGVLKIAANSQTSGYSGAFFNWKIAYGAICGRLPVRAKNICPMPLVFTSFAIDPSQVRWTVASQAACNSYLVETSADGLAFSPMATVACHSGHSYVYQGTKVLHGYFRIRMVATDGRSYYSKVLKSATIESDLSIFPNPSKGLFEIKSSRSGTFKVLVYSVLGQVLFHKEIVDTEGLHLAIDLRETLKSEQMVLVHVYTEEEGMVHAERLVIY